MEEITYRPIGIIRSPFKETKGTPIQTTGAKGVAGTVEILSHCAEGLKDLGGSHTLFSSTTSIFLEGTRSRSSLF